MIKKISIKSDLKNIRAVVDEVIATLKGIKAADSDIFDIRLSLEEALINAIKYGNRFDKEQTVFTELIYDKDRFSVSVEDNGDGFDYNSLPDPTEETNLLKGRGRGVFLIKHLMDTVEFNRKGNRIDMVKYLRKTDSKV